MNRCVRVKQALREVGKTERDLAEKLGTSEDYVREILRSDSLVNWDVLIVAAELTGHDVLWLATGMKME